jgi:hypothetical protein
MDAGGFEIPASAVAQFSCHRAVHELHSIDE